jgi:hypothetical protein
MASLGSNGVTIGFGEDQTKKIEGKSCEIDTRPSHLGILEPK